MSRNEKQEPEVCPVCGKGTLNPSSDMAPIDDFYIEVVFSVCDVCGSEITNNEQAEKNAMIVRYMRDKYK